jgi:hypothetical protein
MVRFKVFLQCIGFGFGLGFRMEYMKNSFTISFDDFFKDLSVYVAKVSKFDLDDNGVYILGVGIIVKDGNEEEIERIIKNDETKKKIYDERPFSFRQSYSCAIDFSHPEFRLDENNNNVFLYFYSELVERLKKDFEYTSDCTLVDKKLGHTYSDGLYFYMKKIG